MSEIERCPLCKARGKLWEGDDTKCSFPNGGEFDNLGWNCATASEIRAICGEVSNAAVDFRTYDDQKYATIDIAKIEMPDGTYWLSLWVTWYKRRGWTEAIWLLSDEAPPKKPNAAECEAIINALKSPRP